MAAATTSASVGRIPSAAGATKEDKVYDAIVIGGGIAGVFMMAEALKQGHTNVIVLEKKDKIGGLWATLPAWQTVQNDPRDFCVQGFTTKKKVWFVKDVMHMLETYVKMQKLEPYIHLGEEVIAHDFIKDDDCWVIKTRQMGGKESASSSSPTPEQVYRCKRLVFCTGKHASPNLPAIPKDDGSVPTLHSSQVQEWDSYKGKRVVVVGAGASGLDLVINSLQVNEKETQGQTFWVMREPKYFGGFPYADLVLITVFQLIFGLSAQNLISFVMNLLFHLRFWYMGLAHWLPRHPFDLQHEQFIPNRSYLLENAHRVDRRAGVEVVEVRQRCVKLSDGSVIENVDALLMGTGYKTPKHPPGMDFSQMDLLVKCTVTDNGLTGRLFLFGETLLDSTASTPISVHVLSRYFWHLVGIDGFSKLQTEGLHVDMNTNINHMDFLNHTAFTARGLYPFGLWRWKMLATHLYYRVRYDTRVFYGDRLLGLNISLDS